MDVDVVYLVECDFFLVIFMSETVWHMYEHLNTG